MRFKTETVQAAFQSHYRKYGTGSRAWDLGHHVHCWDLAHRAFEESSRDDFRELYEELRRAWQVFRGAKGEPWSADVLYDHLIRFDARLLQQRLSEMRKDVLPDVEQAVQDLSEMKPVKHGISIVAISKFLHFANPRLFVIVDYGVMWRWVLAHSWLWRRVAATANDAGLRLQEIPGRSDSICDLNAYLAVLLCPREFSNFDGIREVCL